MSVPSSDPAGVGRAVLVVVDLQNVFGEAGSPWRAPRFDEVVEPVRALTRAYAPHAVYTRFLAPAEPVGAWRAYYADWSFALQPPEAPLWDLVAPLADEARAVHGTDGAGGTLDATTFSKWGPQLAALVGPQGRMVLAGVSTDCCVLSTALAAADAGVEVIVVREGCAGVDDDSHAQALHVMGLYAPLVRVVGLDEALALAPGVA